MRAVVVYESVYGNTHAIAEAVGKGLMGADPAPDVRVVPVGEATDELLRAADLLVVGGPTHARGMSRTISRTGAIDEARQKGQEASLDPDAEGPGLRDWFDRLDRASAGRAAAFDTRGGPRFAGGAAKGIAKRLRRHGYTMVAEPAGFVVEGMDGPLREGETERAKAWAASLLD